MNTVVFNCPEGGQVRCQVDLDSKSQAPNYSLRSEQILLHLPHAT